MSRDTYFGDRLLKNSEKGLLSKFRGKQGAVWDRDQGGSSGAADNILFYVLSDVYKDVYLMLLHKAMWFLSMFFQFGFILKYTF